MRPCGCAAKNWRGSRRTWSSGGRFGIFQYRARKPCRGFCPAIYLYGPRASLLYGRSRRKTGNGTKSSGPYRDYSFHSRHACRADISSLPRAMEAPYPALSRCGRSSSPILLLYFYDTGGTHPSPCRTRREALSILKSDRGSLRISDTSTRGPGGKTQPLHPASHNRSIQPRFQTFAIAETSRISARHRHDIRGTRLSLPRGEFPSYNPLNKSRPSFNIAQPTNTATAESKKTWI